MSSKAPAKSGKKLKTGKKIQATKAPSGIGTGKLTWYPY
jgi:hypothetical protein